MSHVTPYQTFTALGDNWWLQVYDGKYHRFGPEVFDQGLHGGVAEPGFYKSAKKAYQFAAEHLQDNHIDEDLSLELYTSIHQIACSHFTGDDQTYTLISAHQAGQCNRNKKLLSHFFLKHLYLMHRKKLKIILKKDKEYAHFLKFELRYLLLSSHIDNDKQKEELEETMAIIFEEYQFSSIGAFQRKADKIREKKLSLVRSINEKINEINGCIRDRFQDQIACIKKYPRKPYTDQFLIKETDQILIHYYVTDCLCQTRNLINQFNEKIKEAKSRKEKIHWIADLFQALEWLHPFPDGQGRTDIILLGFLLCKYGINPAILDEPYLSTCVTLKEFEKYLLDGIKKWKNVLTEKIKK